MIGFYHSHPNAPAQPSSYDLAHATWPWLSYLIVAVHDGEPKEVKSWVLADDRSSFLPEKVELAGMPADPNETEGET
jgi:proteasome lid subunit RPN8/RPN11